MDNSKKFILDSASYNEKLKDLNEKQNLANSKLISNSGIVCSMRVKDESYIENMKQGYLAMRELNLELSEYGFESYMSDLTEYEASL